MTDHLIITGQSGAGRSTVADRLEDLGWFVIDNLPVTLIPKVAELAGGGDSSIERLALAVGPQSQPDELIAATEDLRSAAGRVRIVFLAADPETLIRRFESTKRRHPAGSGDRLGEAIEAEQATLEPVRAAADLVIDTTELTVHDLRNRVDELLGAEELDVGMQTRLLSFGYKFGLPTDVDVVLDCRFLPNPHWDAVLRPLTGRHTAVRDYVLERPEAAKFLDRLDDLLAVTLPAHAAEGKAYLTIAFGCTGGRHRSVTVAEAMAQRLAAQGYPPAVSHRDIDRDGG